MTPDLGNLLLPLLWLNLINDMCGTKPVGFAEADFPQCFLSTLLPTVQLNRAPGGLPCHTHTSTKTSDHSIEMQYLDYSTSIV